MTCNVGTSDKVFRILVALAIFGAGYHYQSLWGFVGLVPLLTALFGWCPVYLPFGVSTCSTHKK